MLDHTDPEYDQTYAEYLTDAAQEEFENKYRKELADRKAHELVDRAERVSKGTHKPITVNDLLKQKESK